MAWFIFNQSSTLNASSFYPSITLFSSLLPVIKPWWASPDVKRQRRFIAFSAMRNMHALLKPRFCIRNTFYSSATTLWASLKHSSYKNQHLSQQWCSLKLWQFTKKSIKIKAADKIDWLSYIKSLQLFEWIVFLFCFLQGATCHRSSIFL